MTIGADLHLRVMGWREATSSSYACCSSAVLAVERDHRRVSNRCGHRSIICKLENSYIVPYAAVPDGGCSNPDSTSFSPLQSRVLAATVGDEATLLLNVSLLVAIARQIVSLTICSRKRGKARAYEHQYTCHSLDDRNTELGGSLTM